MQIDRKLLIEYNMEIFPNKPFEEEGSFYFLKCVKYNNLDQIKEMIAANKKFVYQYNHLR